jgi:site-specific recombinase
VRHVTLSTGQAAAAVFSLGPDALKTAPFWMAAAGIVVIGVLNVGVSFGMALRVAMRAVDISPTDRATVYRAIRGRLVSHPGEFLWPPLDAPTGAGQEQGSH